MQELERDIKLLAGRIASGRGQEMHWCRTLSESVQDLLQGARRKSLYLS